MSLIGCGNLPDAGSVISRIVLGLTSLRGDAILGIQGHSDCGEWCGATVVTGDATVDGDPISPSRHGLSDVHRCSGGPGCFSDQCVGSYRLGHLVGTGAMGEVYEATHVLTGAVAAVKLLHPEALGRADSVGRFRLEELITSALHDPHIVRVFEVADPSAPLPYFAMELLHGEDLAHRLNRGELLIAETLDLVRQIGAGLDAAHLAGVVHRDLKPQNLFFARKSCWKILDFGVACRLNPQCTSSEGHAVGTPPYMAPEQVTAQFVDHRADIFALGVIAYRTLTGVAPFSGSDVFELFDAIVRRMPPRPSAFADLPEAIDFPIAVALAKQPMDRFESGGAFAAALASAAAGKAAARDELRAQRVLMTQPWAS